MRPFGFSWSFPIYLRLAVEAVRKGVQRVHLVNRHVDGALLGELYTEHGNGKSKPLLLSFCGRSNFSGHGSDRAVVNHLPCLTSAAQGSWSQSSGSATSSR